MTELKPCPFQCLGVDEYEDVNKPKLIRNGNTCHVECQWCGANAGLNYFHESAAIAAWNTRTPDPLVQELVGALSDAIRYIGRGYMGDARELVDRLAELRNRASRAQQVATLPTANCVQF